MVEFGNVNLLVVLTIADLVEWWRKSHWNGSLEKEVRNCRQAESE